MPRDKRLYMTLPIDFLDHPKIVILSDNAIRTFIAMNGYSRQHNLDGRIPIVVAAGRWKKKSLNELLNNHPTRPTVTTDQNDYLIRDYAEHQETNASIEERRQKNTSNGQKGGRPKRLVTQSVTDPNPVGTPSVTQSKAELEIEIEIEETKTKDVAEIRPDVSRLCSILADLIEANGSKRPTIGKGWLDAARLILDADKRPIAECLSLMQWCQADPFWKANILSMPKFREKYDTLRLQQASKLSAGEVEKPKAPRRVER